MSIFGLKILAILAVVSLISKAVISIFFANPSEALMKFPVPKLGSKTEISSLFLKWTLIKFWTASTILLSV